MRGAVTSMEWRQYELKNETIDQISEWLQDLCDQIGVEKREKHRVRLAIEDLLAKIKQHSENTISVEAGVGKQYGKWIFSLQYGGEAFNPADYDDDDWSEKIKQNLGMAPVWSYRRNRNTITYTIKDRAQHGMTFYILVAVVLAIVLGIFGRTIPEDIRTSIDTVLLTPLSDAFMGLMNTFAGLMIAFAICSGILGMGNPSTLRRIGKKFLGQIILLTFLSSIFAYILTIPVVGATFSDSEGTTLSEVATLSEMLFAILPSDPVSPFLNKNTMQIIIISLILGIGMLLIGEQGNHLRNFVEQGTKLFSQLMEMICRMIPVYVFTALLRQIWNDDITAYLQAWKPVILSACLIAAFVVLMILFTAWQIHCPVPLLFRKILPAFLAAFSTASSIAAFGPSMEAGEKLGIDKSFMRFAYPIGSVMYMPAAAIFLSVFTVFFAGEYGIGINISWLITAVIIVSLLSIAVPPLPGSGLMIFSTLFAQLGIPADALVLATLMYIPLDYAVAGGDIAALLSELTRESEQMGILDREKLNA